MNIRVIAVDKFDEDGFIYIIHSEAQWIDEHGQEQIVEFRTHMTEDDFTSHPTEWKRAVTAKAYEVLEEEAFAHSLVGQEWTVPDRKPSGKVISA